MAAIERHWADHDFQDMNTNASELCFTKKMPCSREHIALLIQCYVSGFSNKGHGRSLKTARGSPRSSFSACHVKNKTT